LPMSRNGSSATSCSGAHHRPARSPNNEQRARNR
jgi:hypothetical protein